MKKLLLAMLLLAMTSGPVAASQTEAAAIDTVALAWYQAGGDIDTELDIELELAVMELEATSVECSVYAGWHLAAITIFNGWRFTESPFLEYTYLSMVESTPQMQYACIIAL